MTIDSTCALFLMMRALLNEIYNPVIVQKKEIFI